MRIRKDVVLAPVTKGLKNTVVDDGWLHDLDANWKMGFGRGTVGVDSFVTTFKESLENKQDNFSIFGIYKSRKPVGFVCITYIGRTADILFYIAPEYRKVFGVAYTAMFWTANGIFKTSDVFRIQIELLSINKEAITFLRKFGFKQEGIKKSAYWMGVNSFNVVVLALLKPEFSRLKERENAGRI